ncbi:serine carboxypeptidase-like 45 [Tripterygium wilfordii]|uniref:Serine carboxypeptidase-like 45 n=1 Tax=Tripterygium wilfordii TaxID=458696 RepID=A0A7J7C902_TRIWF|nr:serine carboxypeptidase-like 45 isoform X1 [Tripterygium wilfordii]KAF5730631.1 serine carboxypeptidase-like 45 [Tripterygium wilfordii]
MQIRKCMIALIIYSFFIHTCFVSGDPTEDFVIERLPGQPYFTFQQYAGYVYVDNAKTRALFFYFVEAETQPESRPLVLWLNGGPGCSAVGSGVFIEHGPFRPEGDILIKNEYSWNKVANVLYLDAPAGVGFSYSTNKSYYTLVNDHMTAQDSLEFLNGWFTIFNKYKEHDFYIGGVSYGGHFVTQLANLVVEKKPSYKLKGIALGSPLLDFNTDLNARDEFYWSHGLISDNVYHLRLTVCNSSQNFRESMITGNISNACNTTSILSLEQVGASTNLGDVTGDICLSSGTSQSQTDSSINPQKFGTYVDVCADETTTKYLNREDVKKALHAKLVGVNSWELCSGVLRYDYRDLETPMRGILSSLIESGHRVLVYSGDQDAVVPFLGTRTLLNEIAKELKLNVTTPYRTWFEGRQVAGWTQSYADGRLTFATIRGGDHQAPYNQPARSFTLFEAYLAGRPPPTQ